MAYLEPLPLSSASWTNPKAAYATTYLDEAIIHSDTWMKTMNSRSPGVLVAGGLHGQPEQVWGWMERVTISGVLRGRQVCPQIEKEVTRIHRILPPSQVQKNQRRWAVLGVGWLSVPVCNELSPSAQPLPGIKALGDHPLMVCDCMKLSYFVLFVLFFWL